MNTAYICPTGASCPLGSALPSICPAGTYQDEVGGGTCLVSKIAIAFAFDILINCIIVILMVERLCVMLYRRVQKVASAFTIRQHLKFVLKAAIVHWVLAMPSSSYVLTAHIAM
jgi:hypothetical protein